MDLMKRVLRNYPNAMVNIYGDTFAYELIEGDITLNIRARLSDLEEILKDNPVGFGSLSDFEDYIKARYPYMITHKTFTNPRGDNMTFIDELILSLKGDENEKHRVPISVFAGSAHQVVILNVSQQDLRIIRDNVTESFSGPLDLYGYISIYHPDFIEGYKKEEEIDVPLSPEEIKIMIQWGNAAYTGDGEKHVKLLNKLCGILADL